MIFIPFGIVVCSNVSVCVCVCGHWCRGWRHQARPTFACPM